jgi:colanic acid/amylovoran biosynthesis glycosyltransferase
LIYALQAVKGALDRGMNIEFRIIGDGPLAGKLCEFIRKNKLEKQVRLLGFLDYEAYLSEMNKGDIFLAPSVTAANGDTEGGAPTTVLEAQALGMPVISTYHADTPNVVLPGESALLVPERDSQALAAALAYLVDHPGTWEEMGRSGRGFVEKFHKIDNEVLALEDKYLSLLG